MAPLWAEEVLRERGGSLSARNLYDLTLLATGDKDQAERVQLEKMMADMRENRTPEV